MYRKSAKQRGFTLIEVLIVVGIIVLFAAVALTKGGRAGTSTQVQRLTDEITLIATQARVWKGVRANYNGISMSEMTSMALLDTSWGNGTAVNPLGGNYTVTNTGAAEFNISATGLSPELCAAVNHQIITSTVDGDSSSCSGGTFTGTFR